MDVDDDPLVAVRPVDWGDEGELTALIRMYTDYLTEAKEKGDHGDGAPCATYLITMMAFVRGEAIAFFSLHEQTPSGLPAIELIYVDPGVRRTGVGAALLHGAQRRFPDLYIKGPATAGVMRLAERLGIEERRADPEEAERMQRYARSMERKLSAYCASLGHRRVTLFKPCRKCLPPSWEDFALSAETVVRACAMAKTVGDR